MWRKPKETTKKTTRANKWIHQNYTIQNQYAKIYIAIKKGMNNPRGNKAIPLIVVSKE
jgi:hypothetical protein